MFIFLEKKKKGHNKKIWIKEAHENVIVVKVEMNVKSAILSMTTDKLCSGSSLSFFSAMQTIQFWLQRKMITMLQWWRRQQRRRWMIKQVKNKQNTWKILNLFFFCAETVALLSFFNCGRFFVWKSKIRAFYLNDVDALNFEFNDQKREIFSIARR